jgi:hypothetical protein
VQRFLTLLDREPSDLTVAWALAPDVLYAAGSDHVTTSELRELMSKLP